MFKVATVNVNGIRAAWRKGIEGWMSAQTPDIILLQEVRASEKIAKDLFGDDWDVLVCECAIKGRAGVGVAVRKGQGWSVGEARPNAVEVVDPSDSGRWLEVDLEREDGFKLTVVSAYFHSGEAGTVKEELKMQHLERIDRRLALLGDPDASEYRENLLVAGDFNVVRSELDIKNWKGNHNKSAGVLDEEMAYLNSWFGGQWVDVTRHLVGCEQGPYTWWSWRGKAYENNAGWRIDYQLASSSLGQSAVHQDIQRPDYSERWSDHAPLTVTYSL